MINEEVPIRAFWQRKKVAKNSSLPSSPFLECTKNKKLLRVYCTYSKIRTSYCALSKYQKKDMFQISDDLNFALSYHVSLNNILNMLKIRIIIMSCIVNISETCYVNNIISQEKWSWLARRTTTSICRFDCFISGFRYYLTMHGGAEWESWGRGVTPPARGAASNYMRAEIIYRHVYGY